MFYVRAISALAAWCALASAFAPSLPIKNSPVQPSERSERTSPINGAKRRFTMWWMPFPLEDVVVDNFDDHQS